ncbi:MAG: acyl carrier protein [Myxococcaceae bacterium]|nr:acyl carrier protein [Myxococcaceae bacterium]
MSQVNQRVRQLLSDVLGVPVEQIGEKATRDDFQNWDSAANVQLLMAIEGEFGVTLSVDDAADLLSVELIVAILTERGVS